MRRVVFVIAVAAVSLPAFGIHQSLRSGNWSDSTMWNLGTVPTIANDVKIMSGHIVTVDTSLQACLTLEVEIGAVLDLASNGLTVDQNIVVDGTINGTASLIANGTASGISGNGTVNALLQVGLNSRTIAGALSLFGGVDAGGAITNNGATIVGPSGILGTGSWTQGTSSSLQIEGPITVASFSASAFPNTVKYVGSPQTVRGGVTYNELEALGPGETRTLGGAITVSGDLYIEGTFKDDGYQITGPGLSSGQTLELAGSAFLQIGTNNGAQPSNGTSLPAFQIYTFGATSTVEYAARANQTIAAQPTYANLVIAAYDSPPVTLIKTAGGAIAVAGELTVEETVGSNLTFAIGTSLTIGGDFSGAGDINHGGGSISLEGSNTAHTGDITPNYTIIFSGGNAQNIRGRNYHGLVINKTGGTASLAGAAMVNNLTITAGTLSDNNFTLTGGSGSLSIAAAGTLRLAATFPSFIGGSALDSASTVVYEGDGAQLIALAPTYGNLVVTTGATNASKSGDGAGTLNAVNLQLNNGAPGVVTLDMSGETVDIDGDITGNGNLNISGGTLFIGGAFTNSGAFTSTGSTVTYDGAAPQTVRATDYHDLVINKIGTATLGGNTNVNQDVSVNGGTLNLSSFTLDIDRDLNIATTLQMSTGNIDIDGTITTMGTFDGGTGRLSLNNPSASQAFSGTPASFQLHDLTINNPTAITFNHSASLSGTLELNGASDITMTDPYVLTLGSAADIQRNSASSVRGKLAWQLPAAATKRFELASPNGVYLPAEIQSSGACTITVKAFDGAEPNNATGGFNQLVRFWDIDGGCAVTLALEFFWNAGDINGDVRTFVPAFHNGSTFSLPGGFVDEGLNSAALTGITAYDGHWTAGQASSFGFLAPSVASFSPASGVIGSTVTIFGDGFSGADTVTFDGVVAATFSITNDNEISAEVPAGSADGPIAVTHPFNGTGTSFNDFIVIIPENRVTAVAGDWNSGATWVGGVVPNDYDNATVNHDVTVNSRSEINNVELNANLLGTSVLQVNGEMTWNSGTLFGELDIHTGATMTVPSGLDRVIDGGNLLLKGTAELDASVVMQNATTLFMTATGRIEFLDDYDFRYNGVGGAPTVSLFGTIRKGNGAGFSTVDCGSPCVNEGTIEARLGTLLFASGLTHNVAGNIQFSLSSEIIGFDSGSRRRVVTHGVPSPHGRVQVSGLLSLAGSWSVELNDFTPQGGETFGLLTFGSRSGDFSNATYTFSPPRTMTRSYPDSTSMLLTTSGPTITPPVSPDNGPTAGGTTVTITGTDFVATPAVYFNGTASPTVNWINANTITAVTPAEPAGLVDVVVENPDGQPTTAADAFTFADVPVITTIAPASGTINGGTLVVIDGQYFDAVDSVTFDGIEADIVGAPTSTQVKVRTPAHAIGAVDVVVGAPDGFDTATNGYTYITPVCTAPSGILAWYRINGDSTDSAGGAPINFNGGAFNTGKVGLGIQLNGTTEYGFSNDSIWHRPTTGLTLEGWVKFTSVPVGQFAMLYGKTAGTGTGESYGISYKDGQLWYGIGSPSGITYQYATFTPLAGTWYHIAMTFDDATNDLRMYVDGQLAQSGVETASLGYDTHAFTIGTEYENESLAYFFPGYIDEVTLYDQKLTAAEILAIYDADTAGKCYPAKPALINNVPNTGATGGGTAVVITGSSLLSTSSVVIGNPATVNGSTQTTINATTAATSAGLYSVDVTTTTGTDSIAAAFTFGTPATRTTVQNGDWNNAATWGGTVPTSADNAVVGHNVTLTADATVVNLTLNAGQIGGSSNLTVTSTFSWTGGDLVDSSGELILSSGSTTAISGSSGRNLSRVITNAGTITSTTTAQLTLNSGATIDNLSGGIFDIQSAMYFYLGSGPATFNNQPGALLKKTAGGGTTRFYFATNNDGTVSAENGTLSLFNGGTSNGDFAVSAGATLGFEGFAAYALNATSDVSGAGSVLIDVAATTHAGIWNITGGTSATSGSLTLNGTITSVGPITLSSSGRLNLNSDVSTSSVSLSNSGAIGGTGNLTVNGLFTWQGGTLDGGGTVTIPATRAMNMSGSSFFSIDNRTIDNAGTITFTATATTSMSNGAVIDNQSGGVFDIKGDTLWNRGSGTPAFNNLPGATLKKSAGAGTSEFRFLVVNDGVLAAEAGTFFIGNTITGSATSNGDFNVSAGATLDFAGGTHTLSATSDVAGAGSVSNSGATTTHTGTWNVAGSTGATSGTLTLNGTITSVGAISLSSSGRLNLNSNASATGITQVGSSTALGGSGNLTVNGTYDWQSGTIDGGGTVTIPTTRAMNMTGTSGSYSIDNRTVDNAGTITITGSIMTGLANGAVINNQNGGLFDIQSDSLWFRSGGAAPAFNNQSGALMKKSAGNGTSDFRFDVNNAAGATIQASSGTLLVPTLSQLGTLQFPISGAASFGRIDVDSAFVLGGTLTATTVAYTPVSGTTFPILIFNSSSGTFATKNLTYPGGSFTDSNSGTGITLTAATPTTITSIASGSWNSQSTWDTNTVPTAGDDVIIDGETVTLASNVTIDDFTLTSGAIAGASTLTVNGAFSWTGGMVGGGGGSLSIAATGSMTISGGSSKTLSNFTLNNASSTSTWAAGASNLLFTSGAVFNNSGILTIHNDSSITYDNAGGFPAFNNSGTLRKQTASGTSIIGVSIPFAFNNTGGTLDIQTGQLQLNGAFNVTGSTSNLSSGTVKLNGGGTSSGNFSVGNGATLQFLAGTQTISGAWSGASGTYAVNGGTVTVNNTLSAGVIDLSNATLNGSGTITPGTSFNWSGGTIGGGGGTLNIPGGATLTISGASAKTLSNFTIDNDSTTSTWAAGASNILFTFGAIFRNDGTFTVHNDSSINYDNAGPFPAFNNFGTLRKQTAAGTSVFGVGIPFPFNNGGGTLNIQTGQLQLNGAFNVTASTGNLQSGTLSLYGGGTSSGDFSVAGVAQLAFKAGTHTITGTWSGAAGSNYGINGATVTVNNALSGDTIALINGTLNGSGTITPATSFAWSGGTIGQGGGTLSIPGGAALTISGATAKTLANFTIDNDSNNSTWAAGASNLLFTIGAIFRNDGTFTIHNDSTISYDNAGGFPAFNNFGTLRKQTATGTSIFGANIPFPFNNNSGTVDIQTGQLQLNGAFNVSGSTANLQGGILSVYGGGTSSGDFSVGSGAQLVFKGGTQTITGNWSAPAGTYSIDGGTVTINGGALSAATLDLTSGSLGGSQPITVSTQFNWSGGTIGQGGGSLSVSGTGGLQISGASAKTLTNFTLNNSSANSGWTPGASNLLFTLGAVFNNSGTLTIENDSSISYDNAGGFPSLVNSGTIRKQSATGTSTIGASVPFPVNNSGGTFDIVSGALQINGALTLNGSSFLKFGIGGTTALTGYGRLVLPGSITFAGTINAYPTGVFVPQGGDQYDVITYSSRSGTLTENLSFGAGRSFALTYNAANVTLTASGPAVASVTPTSGSEFGGNSVVITGTGFAGTTPGEAFTGQVKFGTTNSGSVIWNSASQLTAVAPAVSPSTVDVVVTNADAQPGTLVNGYTFLVTPAPTITAIRPSTGNVAGGTTVYIDGTDLDSVTGVTFDASGATIVAQTANILEVITPAHAAGNVIVTITNPGGIATTNFTYDTQWNVARDFSKISNPINAWSYGFAPARTGVFSFFPSTAVSSGINVWKPAAASDPTANHNASASPAVLGALTVPAHAFYLHPGAAGENAIARWTAPAAGQYEISGSFTGIDSAPTTTDGAVLINGVQQLEVFVNAYNTPQNFTLRRSLSGGDIVSFTAGYGQNGNFTSDSTQLAANISILSGPVVTLVSVSPSLGGLTGGQTVTITGNNFHSGAGVVFGTDAATTVNVVNGTTITAVTPAHAAGAVDVTVTHPDSADATLASAYLYSADPHWLNAAGGNWSDGANWSTGSAPGPTDDAYIDLAGTYTVTMDVNAAVESVHVISGVTLAVGARTLTVNGPTGSTLSGALTLGGGEVGGSGAIAVNSGGVFTWGGGNLRTAGGLNIATGGTLNINGGALLLHNPSVINNAGSINWSGGNISLETCCLAASQINNQTGGLFTISVDGATGYNGGGLTINNASGAMLRKTAGGGTTEIRTATQVNNDGAIEVNDGTLLIGGGTSSGTFTIAAGKTLEIGGVAPQSISGSVSGGRVHLTAGTATFTGPYTVNDTDVDGATANFNGAPGTQSTITGSITAGELSGTGELTITGTFDWTGGNMSGSGTLKIVQPNGVFNLNDPGGTVILAGNRLIDNYDAFNWLAGTLQYPNGASTIRHQNGATFTINGTVATQYNGGTGVIETLAGSTTTSNGAATLFDATTFNHNGTLTVQSGTLAIGAGTSGGNFHTDAGATLRFHPTGSTQNVNGSVTGNRVTLTDGTTNFGAAYNVNDTDIAGGTANFNGALGIQSMIDGSLSSGTLSGTGELTVNGTFDWTNGHIGGAGTMKIAAPNGVFNLNSGSTVTVSGPRIIDNYDTINWTAGSLQYAVCCAVFTIRNQSGAEFNVTANVATQYNGGSGVIENLLGSNMTVSGGGTATLFDATTFHHHGTLTVQSGTLSIDAGTSSGSFTVNGAGTLKKEGGGTQTVSGAVSSAGIVAANGGTIAFSGNYTSTNTNISNGRANFNGAAGTQSTTGGTLGTAGILGGTGELSITGNYNWTGGQIDGAGTLKTVNGGGVLTVNATQVGLAAPRVIENQGRFNWDAGNISLDGTGTSTFNNRNGALVSIITDGSTLFNGSSMTLFNESGANFRKSITTGATTLNNVGFTNDGEVELWSGILSLPNGYTQTANGLYDAYVSSPTPGDYSRIAASTVSLAGTLDVNASFTPANGATFDLLTFSSNPGSSDFAAKTGLTYTGGTFTYTLGAAAATLTAVENSADLSITKVASTSTVAVNNAFSYTIAVNNGTAGVTAQNITVTDVLPASLTYQGSSGTGWTCNSPPATTVTCTMPSLAPGPASPITLFVSAPATPDPSLSNTASVDATTPDSNAANDSASATVAVIVPPANLTVTNLNDSGAGSLRQALDDANAGLCAQPCTIAFSVGGTIAPLTALPSLNATIIINATTAPGYAGSPVIGISGASCGGCVGFSLDDNSSDLKGLAIYGFNTAVVLAGTGGHILHGNHIGLDLNGNVAPNTTGIELVSSYNTIGGEGTNEPNVISGNTGDGIFVELISGGGETGGVQSQGLFNVDETQIAGNYIGTNANGDDLGNGGDGVFLGSGARATAVENNVIAYNAGDGIRVEDGDAHNFFANSVYANDGDGINLVSSPEPTANDGGDLDSGPNNLQNKPVISGATIYGANLEVTLSIDSANVPATLAFDVDLYEADAGEGRTYLGSQCIDGNSISNFTFEVPAGSVIAGSTIVATATSLEGTCASTPPIAVGDGTSEFSAAFSATACTPPPTTITPSGSTAICAGSSVTLNAPTGAGYSYQWFESNVPINAETSSALIVNAAGSYTVEVTDGSGCPATSAPTVVTVNPIPAPPTASNTGPYCEGGTIQLNASLVAGATYTWAGPNGFTSNLQNPTLPANAASAGPYSVTVTVNGCTSSAASTTVTITAAPATPAASNGGPYCENATIQLNAATVAGATYAWIGPNGFTSNLQNPTLTATLAAAGSYNVTATVSGCTSTASSTAVVVNPIPAAPVASNTGPYCNSGTIQLNASVIAGAAYSWTGPNGFISALQNPTLPATPAAAGSYFVNATVNGCTSLSSSTTVSVNAVPDATISAAASVCANTSTTASVTPFAGATYTWSITNGTIDSGDGTPSISFSVTGASPVTLNVTVAANGCSASDSHVLTVGAFTPTITPSGPTSFCTPGSVTLNASAATSYQWLLNGNPIGGATASSLVVTAAGSYSVNALGAGGCSGTSSPVVVTVNTPIVPVISAGGPTSFCTGGSVVLSSTAAASYQWLLDGTPINSANAQTFTATASGSYTVTTVDGNGCSATSSPVAVTANAPLVVNITGPTATCAASPVVLDAGPGASWSWSTGESTRTITVAPTTPTSWNVTVFDGNGCSGSDSHTVNVTSNPTAAINAPAAVCSLSTGNTASVTQPGAVFTWSITGGTITSGQNTSTITFSANSAGSVALGVTVTVGSCTSTGNATIPIAAPPTVTITGPATTCPNVPFTLDAGPGFVSYQWSNNTTGRFMSTSQNSQSGTYSVTVTDANSCTATASHTVTLASSPDAAIDAPNAVDSDSPGNTASAAAQAGATYAWSIVNGTITAGAGTNSITFTAGNSGSVELSLQVTIASCSATSTTLIVIGDPPPRSSDFSIAKSAPSSVQAGSSLTYTIVVGNNGPGASDAVIVDTLPAGVTVTGIADGPWTCNNSAGQITCTGFLAAGAANTITINTTAPQQAGTIVNTVVVDGTADDPNSANDSASATTQITAIPTLCPTVPPSLIAPTDNATVTSPVAFSWSVVNGATSYELWITTNGTIALAGTTAATSLSVPVPSGISTWHVIANVGSDCEPLVAAQRTFTIQESDSCAAHGAPQLTSPGANASTTSPVSFSWTAVPQAIGYRVWIEVNGGAAQDIGTTDGAITLTADVPAGAIVASVDALFGGCPPTRSEGVAFEVTQPDPCATRTAATLITPANNTTLQTSNVTFGWNPAAGASAYRVWASVDGAVAEVIGTTSETSLAATIEKGEVIWWVESLYDGCASTESPRFRFVIPAQQNCGTALPSTLFPANNVTVSNASVTFSWTPVPNAIAYEVWLATANGTPILIGTIGGNVNSLTRTVPPGELEWSVVALIDRCLSRESAKTRFTYAPPAACVDNQRPILVSPLDGIASTSPINFEWNGPVTATRFELYVVRGAGAPSLIASTTNNELANVSLANGALRWFVRAYFGESCSPLDSAEQELTVIPTPAACGDLDAPSISAPGEISSGVPFLIQWAPVAGATSYQLQIASSPEFDGAENIATSGTLHEISRTNEGATPLAVYARVRAIDSRCTPLPAIGFYGPTSAIFILPEQGTLGTVPLGDDAIVTYTIVLGPELAGQTFTAIATQPWLTVTPASGVVAPGGTTLVVQANTSSLDVGTNIGAITVNLSGPTLSSNATSVSTPISVNLVTPVTPSPKNTPPPDAMIIPAVANAAGINAQFQSDVRVSNTSPQLIKYQLTFIPSGDAGISAGRQTTFSIEPGRTVALDDVLKSWFGTGTTNAIGSLEIRPLTKTQTSTSSAAVGALANIVSFASSRTFNVTPTGTFGQYIPAVPFANFLGKAANAASKNVLSLQQISQSDKFRTNLGLVEGSGEKAELLVKVFGSSGQQLTSFPVTLNGGQHTQLNAFLFQKGITLNDGRVEVEVVSGSGKITAYASVLDNATSDAVLVTPVTLSDTGNTKWVVPGVADIATGFANWKTDMRVFNAGTETADLIATFYSQNGGAPKIAQLSIPPGEVRQLDKILPTLFNVTSDGGAVHLDSAKSARLIATARTYNETSTGSYGLFASAVTPQEAVGVGSRPLQLLQVEESSRYRSNIGFAEVTGKPVKLEVTVIPPDVKFAAIVEVELAANEFRQIGALLSGLGLGTEVYNARISVRAIEGQGRATAYAAVIDMKTNDPTYVPAQ